MKHTPTPWKSVECFGNIYIEDERGTPIAKLGDTPADKIRANAEHIVKCVNAHDELMEYVRNTTFNEGDDGWKLLKKYGGK